MKSPELKDRLEESEKLIQEMTVTWEEKLRKTEEIAQVCVSWFCGGLHTGTQLVFLTSVTSRKRNLDLRLSVIYQTNFKDKVV